MQKRGILMNELYELIEEKIKGSGYPKEIDGREFYNDISDEADEKENGTYMFIIKKTDTLQYQGIDADEIDTLIAEGFTPEEVEEYLYEI